MKISFSQAALHRKKCYSNSFCVALKMKTKKLQQTNNQTKKNCTSFKFLNESYLKRILLLQIPNFVRQHSCSEIYTRTIFVDLRQAVAVLTSELDRTVTVLEYSCLFEKKVHFPFFQNQYFTLEVLYNVQCTISPFLYASFYAFSHPLKTFNPFKTSFNDWITSLKERPNQLRAKTTRHKLHPCEKLLPIYIDCLHLIFYGLSDFNFF